MIIDNKEYIKLKIREILYYYILKDYDDLKSNIDNKKIENKIYINFIRYLSKKYNIKKIIEINDFRDEIIYNEINVENILFDIIEECIY